MDNHSYYWEITHAASGAVINSGFTASKPSTNGTPEGYTMTVTHKDYTMAAKHTSYVLAKEPLK